MANDRKTNFLVLHMLDDRKIKLLAYSFSRPKTIVLYRNKVWTDFLLTAYLKDPEMIHRKIILHNKKEAINGA